MLLLVIGDEDLLNKDFYKCSNKASFLNACEGYTFHPYVLSKLDFHFETNPNDKTNLNRILLLSHLLKFRDFKTSDLRNDSKMIKSLLIIPQHIFDNILALFTEQVPNDRNILK